MYDGTGNDDGFMLGVGVSRDVGKLEEFFNDRKYRCDQFTLMINCRIDHALALKELMWHYMPVMFLPMRYYTSHGVVDKSCGLIAGVRNIVIFYSGDNLLDDVFLHSCHFT